ncbi:Serine/threonine-protein phosphatase 7 long form homolog [Linum grandiflorum]
MERWRSETNTFHMYHGECTISLPDVAHLKGLPVMGDVLYTEYEKEMNWAALVEEVLGKPPGRYLKGDRRVKMGWLHDLFYSCTDIENDDETQLIQHTCTYMLSIIRGFMLPDRSSAYVHCQYLLALRERRPFAWGATVLSWMYRELGRVTFKIGRPSFSCANRRHPRWIGVPLHLAGSYLHLHFRFNQPLLPCSGRHDKMPHLCLVRQNVHHIML